MTEEQPQETAPEAAEVDGNTGAPEPTDPRIEAYNTKRKVKRPIDAEGAAAAFREVHSLNKRVASLKESAKDYAKLAREERERAKELETRAIEVGDDALQMLGTMEIDVVVVLDIGQRQVTVYEIGAEDAPPREVIAALPADDERIAERREATDEEIADWEKRQRDKQAALFPEEDDAEEEHIFPAYGDVCRPKRGSHAKKRFVVVAIEAGDTSVKELDGEVKDRSRKFPVETIREKWLRVPPEDLSSEEIRAVEEWRRQSQPTDEANPVVEVEAAEPANDDVPTE